MAPYFQKSDSVRQYKYNFLQYFSIFQVLAPNDIQEVSPPLDSVENATSSENDDEVVINFDGSVDAVNSSLCVDTSAFVGVTVTFIMILVVALITIVFLWMRIKSLDTKTKRCF